MRVAALASTTTAHAVNGMIKSMMQVLTVEVLILCCYRSQSILKRISLFLKQICCIYILNLLKFWIEKRVHFFNNVPDKVV